jgi:hypothetical protein
MQPLLKFNRYPSDTQVINIRYGSYAYNEQFLVMNYWGDPLSFNTNFDGSLTFMSNPIWTYDNSSTSYATYTSGSNFLNAIFHIAVTRKGSGIVIRLVLPITLLILLSSLTFWVDDVPSRIDSTVTLLLSVSALYIVILSNIPLLGYLTDIDKYVFMMFLLLILVVAVHQAHSTLQSKLKQWPLRLIYVRLFDMMGRVALFPVVMSIYVSNIKQAFSPSAKQIVLALSFTAAGIIFIREINGVKKVYREALVNLVAKVNHPETKVNELSTIEVMVFNLWMFNSFSSSVIHISSYLHSRGDFARPDSGRIEVRELYPQHLEKIRSSIDQRGGFEDDGDGVLRKMSSMLPSIYPRRKATDADADTNRNDSVSPSNIIANVSPPSQIHVMNNPMYEMRNRPMPARPPSTPSASGSQKQKRAGNDADSDDDEAA